jgi:hypothetical protein
MSQPPDDFMTADLAWISEWLLETATSMVESECEARGCSDSQLLQRRQEIASPRVQRALDVRRHPPSPDPASSTAPTVVDT